MKFLTVLEKDERELDVRMLDSGVYEVTCGERVFHVDARAMTCGWSLLIDGRSYEADILRGEGDALKVRVKGHEYPMEVLDERRLRMRSTSGGFAVEGRAVVKAPMPGKVVRVLVEEGEEVAEGQGLVVMEAMKMENELKAPKAGTVTELPGKVGALVEAEQVLAVVE